MRVLQINTVYPEGSTGKIAAGIHDFCVKQGIECITAYRYRGVKTISDTKTISSFWDCHVHNRIAKWTMLQGCFSFFKTLKFLRWVRKYDPDIVNLHNIHGSYIHHGLLFNYLKSNSIKVVWTMHDCWALTGGCTNYDMIGCEKWKNKCSKCPQRSGLLDLSRVMHNWKKKWFSQVSRLTLVANSKWTAAQIRYSFLKSADLKVIYNGVDLSVFKPTSSNIRERYNILDEHIVLGVAFVWGGSKGIDVFIELSKRLDQKAYRIILVGTDETVDESLPSSIISIHRTQDQRELAEIYSVADLFVNPTREETLGMVNIEANACGTPVVTFNTGGSPECIDSTSGSVVEKDDIDAMEKEIIRICETKPYSREACIERAKHFDKNARFQEYIDLYKEITR